METNDLFQPVFLTEQSPNRPLIVVDVQPAYEYWIKKKFYPGYLADVMNKHQGPILMFVNAERDQQTLDTKDSIFKWWYEQGLEPSVLYGNNFTYYDKGFGYMRSWMELVPPREIIKAIRFMFQEKEWDSRDIDPKTWNRVLLPYWDDWMEDDPLLVNWVGIDLLRRHSGYICGGGKNECLREVTLMMNAFNIKYKMLERFVYG